MVFDLFLARVRNPFFSQTRGLVEMESLERYVRDVVTNVRQRLEKNDVPTPLKMTRFVKETVAILSDLIADVPEEIHFAIRQPWEGLYDFPRNQNLPHVEFNVQHLVFVLQQYEKVFLQGREVFSSARVEALHAAVRRAIAAIPLDKQEELLNLKAESSKGVELMGAEVSIQRELAADGSHHIFRWHFGSGGEVHRAEAPYWDEDFDYGDEPELED